MNNISDFKNIADKKYETKTADEIMITYARSQNIKHKNSRLVSKSILAITDADMTLQARLQEDVTSTSAVRGTVLRFRRKKKKAMIKHNAYHCLYYFTHRFQKRGVEYKLNTCPFIHFRLHKWQNVGRRRK